MRQTVHEVHEMHSHEQSLWRLCRQGNQSGLSQLQAVSPRSCAPLLDGKVQKRLERLIPTNNKVHLKKITAQPTHPWLVQTNYPRGEWRCVKDSNALSYPELPECGQTIKAKRESSRDLLARESHETDCP